MMTIHLPEDLEQFIHAKVQSGEYLSEDAAIAEAVRRLKQWELEHARQANGINAGPSVETTSSPRRKRISEVFEAIRQEVPKEEWDRLPVDGAEQHDHYIYGLPKQPVS
jgi:putative addiction module CopG family antidote